MNKEIDLVEEIKELFASYETALREDERQYKLLASIDAITDFEALRKMFSRAGIAFEETGHPTGKTVEGGTYLAVRGGYAGFVSTFLFELGALKSVEAYE